jgi:Protein of unknown function (DUF1344)
MRRRPYEFVSGRPSGGNAQLARIAAFETPLRLSRSNQQEIPMSFKRIAPIVVLAGVLASPAAYAAPMTKSGEIKSINAVKHEIHLASGETFSLPKTYNFKKLKVGEKVTVSYEKKGNRMLASEVTTGM